MKINNQKVEISSYTPRHQYEWAKKIAVQSETYFQVFYKFPQLGIFHSYSELLFAALLESKKQVTSFTPQPLNIYIGGRRYVPDFFHLENGIGVVSELKPRGDYSFKLRSAMEEALKVAEIEFRVVSNESVKKRETEALNWLQLVRTIVSNRHLDTKVEEQQLFEDVSARGSIFLYEVIDQSDRNCSLMHELALYRLIYNHRLVLVKKNERINFGSKVSVYGR